MSTHPAQHPEPTASFDDPNPYHSPADGMDLGTEPGIPVGPVGAIKRYYSQYAHFTGRASRSEYWWMALYFFLIFTAITAIGIAGLPTTSSAGSEALSSVAGLLYLLVVLAHLVPNIALAVRRLHDGGFSGWLFLLNLVPLLGPLIFLFFMLNPSTPAGARYDAR